MKKISVQGGAAVTLCDAPYPRGAAWGDGSIFAALDLARISRVPDAGGAPVVVGDAPARGQRTNRWPQILPGGDALLYTASAAGARVGFGYDNSNIDILSLRTGKVKTVLTGGYFGRYLASGHLVYVHDGTLFAIPFDPGRLENRGAPVPVLDDVDGNAIAGSGRFDFSQTGTFIYMSGNSLQSPSPLVWMDASGKTEKVTPPRAILSPRISPDGKRIAVSIADDIFTYDISRDSLTKLTFNGWANRSPVWMPDGKHIAFQSAGPGQARTFGISWVRADGAGQPQLLLETDDIAQPFSTTPDGKRIAYAETGAKGTLWTLPLDVSDPDHPKAGKPERLMDEPFDLLDPAISPDGHWLAYVSYESSGAAAIFVRPFPYRAAGGKWLISSGGPARFPFWSRNGHELIYRDNNDRIMVVPYATRGELFIPEKAHPWSDVRVLAAAGVNLWSFDLAPDGKRILLPQNHIVGPDTQATTHATVLLNFFDELRRRVPAGK